MRGNLSVAGQAVHYDAAAHQDAVNAYTIEWMNAYGGFIASVPGVGTIGDLVKAGIWFALPVASAHFSTGNAATANDNAQNAINDDQAAMRGNLLRALAASGKISTPPGHPEFGDPATTLDAQQVDLWWAQAKDTNVTLVGGGTESLNTYFNDNLQNPFSAGSGEHASHTAG